MKKYFLFLSIIALASCKKYLDVNTDPNNATITRAIYVFTNAENATVGNISAGANSLGSTWTGYWAHSTSFTGGGQEKTYVFTNNDFNYFDGWYDNLNDYQYVINNASKDGTGYLVGPSKVMQCLMWQKLVDIYGNIPYSQALKGTGFTYPVYDDAKTIYEDLIVKLTSAINDINNASFPTSEPQDIIFKGNKTNWVRLANSLKLRILMRQSNMAGRDAYIIGAINSISGGFLTDNAYGNPGYQKSSGKLNPFYGTFGYDQNDAQLQNFAYRKANAVIVNWLKNSNDVYRLQRITTDTVHVPGQSDPNGFVSTNKNDYNGVPMGSPTNYLEAVCSSIGSEQIKLGDATRLSVVMTFAESEFLQAEAAERYGLLGSASTHYTAGVQAAFRLAAATQTGTSSDNAANANAAATTYLGFPAVTTPSGPVNITYGGTTADKLKSIWVQKWVALCNIDGMEAWAEYRRTNTTNASGVVTNTGSVPYSPRSVTVSGAEPVRLFYPLREESVNSGNVPQGINVFTSKVFWDAN